MTQAPMWFGRPNDAGSEQTTLKADTIAPQTTLRLENTTADVLEVKGGAIGVVANAEEIGLLAEAKTGVQGNGVGAGVMGRCLTQWSGTGNGVFGASNVPYASGVYGQNDGGGYGVAGRTKGPRAAVFGDSTGVGPGVVGFSATGFAGVFWSGQAVEGNGFPPPGEATLATAGGLWVRGRMVKEFGEYSEALQHPDGSKRLFYAQMSPESWYEDFGRAELVDGRAHVDLDPDFVALLGMEDGNYHVFLTPEADTSGLYVSSRSADAFEVREQQGGTSSRVTFSFRVVASHKRRQPGRLARFEAAEEMPTPAEVPDQGRGEPSG